MRLPPVGGGILFLTMERDFKGIWIPKEVWLTKDLNIIEKLFLVEIDSLDNKNGCFASNKYFSEFFGISKGRCSQIISSLERKGYLTIYLKREGKQIIGRSLRVFNKLNTLVNKLNTPYLKNEQRVFKKHTYPYLENIQDNNTNTNNTINNTNKVKTDFLIFWDLYDKKIGKKDKVLKKWDKLKLETQNEILEYIPKYKISQPDKKFRKNPETFLNNESWKDEILKDESVKRKPQITDVNVSEYENPNAWKWEQ